MPESHRALVDREVDPSLFGYIMQVHCPGPSDEGESDFTVVDNVKIFRNRADLRFEGRIHEQVLPAIRRAGGDVAWTDLYVVHSGSDPSRAAQDRKRERDFRLLHLEYQERPHHPFTLFNLGMTYSDAQQFEDAAMYLERCIEHSGEGESHLLKAYALLVYSQMQLGRPAADETCAQALGLFPRDAELWFRLGVLRQREGRLEEAAEAYKRLLTQDEPRHFASVDSGLKGFKAHQNLAIVALDRGDLAESERRWRLVVRDQPRHRAGWRGLVEALFRQGKDGEADAVGAELVQDRFLHIEGLVLQGKVCAARGAFERARTLGASRD